MAKPDELAQDKDVEQNLTNEYDKDMHATISDHRSTHVPLKMHIVKKVGC